MGTVKHTAMQAGAEAGAGGWAWWGAAMLLPAAPRMPDAYARRECRTGAACSVARMLVAMRAALGLLMLVPALARAQSVEWTQRAVSGPSPRYLHAMACDTARGVAVLFGGRFLNGTINGETWEWNGTAWTQRLVGGPSARYVHEMAYDSARHVTVLFGGFNGNNGNGETWEWNGTAWTQQDVSGPSPRYFHAMAYDTARGVTVLFGGTSNGFDGNDETWEWNGTAWTQRAVSGPSARYGHAMAYDSARGVTVLFGGGAHDFVPNGETWEWDGTAWALRAVSGLSPRGFHAMAYDTARGVTVLQGGQSTNGNVGDTREWNGTVWTLGASGPSSRLYHAMAYDAARDVTVLYGGYTGTPNGETWELACAGLSVQPASQVVCLGNSASITVIAVGAGPFAYQWRHGVPRVAIPGATNATYTIGAATVADAGLYDCVVTNACGTTTSGPATLIVACPADFNCDGHVDVQDFLAFLSLFAAADPRADFNASGSIDVADFLAFLSAFAAGC
jgi:hypothetical protein